MEHYIKCKEQKASGQAKLLGKGTFGKVYKCDGFAEKEFKRFIDDKLDSTTIKEISIAKNMNHPYITPLLAEYSIGKTMYAYYPVALSDLLDSQRSKLLTPEKIKIYSYQLVHALGYLQSVYVVHLDIKANNILIFPNDVVKLTDFGEGEYLVSKENLPGVSIGSTTAPPSRYTNNKRIKFKYDIWSLGVTILEFFVENNPFRSPGTYDYDQFFKMVLKNQLLWLGLPPKDFIDNVNDKHKNVFTEQYTKTPKINTINIPEDVRLFLKRILVWKDEDRPYPYELLSDPYFQNVPSKYNVQIRHQTLPLNKYPIYSVGYPEYRKSVLPWIFQKCEQAGFSPYYKQVYFMTVYLLDLYKQVNPQKIVDLEVYCAMASLSASFRSAAGNGLVEYDIWELWTKKQVKTEEIKKIILSALKDFNYDLFRITSYDYLLELQYKNVVSNDTFLLCEAFLYSCTINPGIDSEFYPQTLTYLILVFSCILLGDSVTLSNFIEKISYIQQYITYLNYIISRKELLNLSKYAILDTDFASLSNTLDMNKLINMKLIQNVVDIPYLKSGKREDGEIHNILYKEHTKK